MKCRHCGGELTRNGEGYVCPECGAKYRKRARQAPEGGAKKPVSHKRTPKKPPKKNGPWIVCAVGLIAAVTIALIVALAWPRGTNPQTPVPTETSAPATEAPEETPVSTQAPSTSEPTEAPDLRASAHIRAVGDIMSHQLQITHALQDDGTYNYDPQFEMVRHSLNSADYTIGNLEMSLSADGTYSSYPKFRVPNEILDTLSDCGFDMLTMANNHILDGDATGFFHTVEAVDAAGFDYVGVGTSREESREPKVVEIGGIRFGFLAYTYGTNSNEKRAYNKEAKACIRYLADADFEKDVKQLREAGAEVVVCLPHWGKEETWVVTDEVKKYAEKMIDAGVDIILGSHPHEVQAMELREVSRKNGATDKVLIAWSMGNFISYMANEDVDCGVIVDFTVERAADGTISIRDVGYVPVYVWGTKRDFHVLCSGEYLYEQPEGMPKDIWRRMRESYYDVIDRCGREFTVLDW